MDVEDKVDVAVMWAEIIKLQAANWLVRENQGWEKYPIESI